MDKKFREFNKKCGVYLLECIANGRIYVGSTTDLYTRKFLHFSQLRKNKHRIKELLSDFQKFGEKNFVYKVFLQTETLEEAIIVEQKVFDNSNKNNLYNKTFPYHPRKLQPT